MERDKVEQLFQLIGTERCNRILKVLSREARVDGWRKGKVPVSFLQNMLKTPGIPQQHFFRLVIKSYFPEVDPTTIDPDSLSDSPDALPGKIAAYALRGREQQIVWPHEEISTDINNHTTQDDITTIISDKRSEEPKQIADLHTLDTDSYSTHDTIEKLDESHAVEERLGTWLSTRYLGYVQVVTNNYNNTFYNFHPIAQLDDSNHVSILDADERTSLFPEKGNINIFARYRNEADRLEVQFGNGGIFVIDLDHSMYEDNIRNGELNRTNIKIDIVALTEAMAIHQPNDFGIYALTDVPELETALRSQSPIELSRNAVVSADNEMVLLRSNGRIAGPFSVFTEGGVQYANPLSKKRNFLFSFYDESEIDQLISIHYPGGAYGSMPQYCTYVNTSTLTSYELDLITDDELISSYEKSLEQRADNADRVIQSAFVGTDLPNHITQQRRDRMQTLMSQQQSLDSTSDQLSQLIDKLIIDAAGNDSERFEEFFDRLAKNPNFLDRFQKHRSITRAINDAQAQLDEKRAALQEQQVRIDELQQQIETERVGKLNAEIEDKQRTVEKLDKDVAALSAKLNLANDIEKLRFENRYQEDLQRRIKEQTDGLLKSFQSATNDTLEKVAQVVLDEPVADIVANLMKKNRSASVSELNKHLLDKAKAYADICCAECSDSTQLVKTLCERVQQYRQYSYNDIVNLLICMMQGRLSVFSGAPGTGKTSICLILAHVLGLDTIKKSENCGGLRTVLFLSLLNADGVQSAILLDISILSPSHLTRTIAAYITLLKSLIRKRISRILCPYRQCYSF